MLIAVDILLFVGRALGADGRVCVQSVQLRLEDDGLSPLRSKVIVPWGNLYFQSFPPILSCLDVR